MQAERAKTPDDAARRDLPRHVERDSRRRDDPREALGAGPHRRRRSIHFEQANIVHLGDLLNNRGYPNCDAPAGATVHGWMQVLEKMAAAFPPMRSTSSATPKPATRSSARAPTCTTSATTSRPSSRWRARARSEGKTKDELAKVEVLPKFEHFGGTKARLGLALTIAYDELAKNSA